MRRKGLSLRRSLVTSSRARYVVLNVFFAERNQGTVVEKGVYLTRYSVEHWAQISGRRSLLLRDRRMAGGRSSFGRGGLMLDHACEVCVVVAGILPRDMHCLVGWDPVMAPYD